ncbi:MAG: response regulator transcription factor, partial [Lachnospiraceae bacterium]|nr:response regulator transcription factor [Lachnospiraceae bacterium]
MTKVLVVDDEKMIVKGIRFSLLQEGWEVDDAYDGEEGLEKARHTAYDIVLLDIMLPKMSGIDVCREIRMFSNMPIIMLTAKGDDMDKIIGFENGADDYITKPFNILEVKARMKAIMRRNHYFDAEKSVQKSQLKLQDLMLDTENETVYVAGREV